MRFVPLSLLLLLTLAFPAVAQQQEKTLSQRLSIRATDEAAKKMVFDTRQASFSSARTYNAKSASGKSFGFQQRSLTKEFHSKEYAGAKSAWMGDFKFSTRQANTSGKYSIPNATRVADTKSVDVADARESEKGMVVNEYSKSNRQYLGREAQKMKKHVDPSAVPEGSSYGNRTIELGGALKEMTIEDIRELLNKNE